MFNKATKVPTYTNAVDWIAANDETAEMDPAALADLISVVMVADLFGVDAEQIAHDVVGKREADAREAFRSNRRNPGRY